MLYAASQTKNAHPRVSILTLQRRKRLTERPFCVPFSGPHHFDLRCLSHKKTRPPVETGWCVNDSGTRWNRSVRRFLEITEHEGEAPPPPSATTSSTTPPPAKPPTNSPATEPCTPTPAKPSTPNAARPLTKSAAANRVHLRGEPGRNQSGLIARSARGPPLCARGCVEVWCG